MADKRPKEEHNDQEKESQKKEKESHADKLKKGIADRVKEFLATQEGKDALLKGKEHFVKQFLDSRESSDEDALAAYKELIGKKVDDELTMKDLADIKLSYEETFETYISGAEKEQFTAIQENAVAQTFIDKMEKEIQGKHFQQQHRDAWKQYVTDKRTSITDRDELDKCLKNFFQHAGLNLSEDQKKRLRKVSIELRDVASHMTEQAGFDKSAADKLNKKEIISANTDAEDMVKRFLRTYAQNEVRPAYDRIQQTVNEIQSIYKVPGFQRVLDGYDLSAQTLAKDDKEFAAVYSNADATDAQKKEAQHKAIVAAIARKDKALADIIEQLFAHQCNLARLDKKTQQAYVDRFHQMRADSKEMKTFDELFEKIGADKDYRKDLTKQIFDLSSDVLKVKSKDGKEYTISLKKQIIDRDRRGETVSEELAHELPIAFLLTPNESLDEEYVRKIAKATDKAFVMLDAEGKEQQIFPGNLVEITTKDGKKHTGHIYKDPEGNVFLGEQPGSAKKIQIKKEELQGATVRVIEQTYALKADDIPVLISDLTLMREAAALPEDKQKEAIDHRNAEVAEHVVESVKNEQNHPTDAELHSFDREREEAVKQLKEEKARDWQRHIDERLIEITKRQDKISKQLADQDNIIKSLNEQLKVAHAKKPFEQAAVDRLQANLTEAQNKREELIDEKHDLDRNTQDFQYMGKKLHDKLSQKKDKAGMAVESEEKEKSFLESRGDLYGDKTLSEPIAGKTCLMLLLPETSSSTGGGGGAWIRGDIIGYDADTQTIQIKRHGVEAKLAAQDKSSLEGKVTTIQGLAELQALKRAASKLYKFKKYDSVSQRGMDLKGGVVASDDANSSDIGFHFDKKYEGRRKHLKDDIDFASMKHQETKKDIKYFGKKVGNDRVWFETELHGSSIRVKEIRIKEEKDDKGKVKARVLEYPYTKEMPINDFMMFAMEKDLRGYTQEDVDTANGGNDDASKKGRNYIDDNVEPVAQPGARFGTGVFGLRWGSIAGLMSSRDIVKKGVKNHFDEKAKKSKSAVENAMLSSARFKSLEKLPIVGGAFDDIRGGIESKLDNEKKKKINEYKDEVGTKKDTSSSGGSDFIKNVLTDKEARKDPLKAAGYYLYALEQGNPYFRSLKDFQGTGRWVGKILGPEYQKQYLAYIKNIENELKKNPSSKELNNDLSMGELGFMQKVFNTGGDTGVQDELKKMAGNWFFTGGLGQAQYGMRYNSAKIEETVKNEGQKPFHQLFGDARTGWYEASRINDVLGVLKLLSEKVGSNETYYYQRAGAMLMPLVNEQYRTDMSPSYKSTYQAIARKNAFPFAAYMTEGNATEKVQELFDIVGEKPLSKYMDEEPKEKDGKKLSEMAVRTSAFKKRRGNHGPKALDILQNPKELFALKKKLEGQFDQQDKLNQYNTLSDYINKKYNDDDRSGITEQVDGESIIYQKNIFSAPSGFVKEQMLNFSNGQFKGRSEKNGPELWEALKAKLNDINNIPEGEMSADFFAFLLKRYFAMFQQKYNGTTKRTFIASLKYADEPGIFQFNVRGVFDKRFGGTDLPAEVEDTLELFERVFSKHGKVLQKHPEILEDVFDDARMVDHYVNATRSDTLKTVDTLKQKQKERERLLDSGAYDVVPSTYGDE